MCLSFPSEAGWGPPLLHPKGLVVTWHGCVAGWRERQEWGWVWGEDGAGDGDGVRDGMGMRKC